MEGFTMAEAVTFSTSVEPPATVFRIAMLSLDWFNSHITVHLREWDTGTNVFKARTIVAHYTGTEAMTLMTSLNKANLTTQSLHQRVMTKLLADGKIPSGTSSGVPD
jgi:hypothetical protein